MFCFWGEKVSGLAGVIELFVSRAKLNIATAMLSAASPDCFF